MDLHQTIAHCLNGDIHWFSQQILDYYLTSRIPTGEFLRWFHMPNSDYLENSACIAAAIDPAYVPGTWQPGIMDGYVGVPPAADSGGCAC